MLGFGFAFFRTVLDILFFYFIICRVVDFGFAFFSYSVGYFIFLFYYLRTFLGWLLMLGASFFFRTVSDILFFYFIGRAKKGRSGGRYTRARIPDTPAAVANVLLWNVR